MIHEGRKGPYTQSPRGPLIDPALGSCNQSFWPGEWGHLMATPGTPLSLWLVGDGVSSTHHDLIHISHKKFWTRGERKGKEARKSRLGLPRYTARSFYFAGLGSVPYLSSDWFSLARLLLLDFVWKKSAHREWGEKKKTQEVQGCDLGYCERESSTELGQCEENRRAIKELFEVLLYIRDCLSRALSK